MKARLYFAAVLFLCARACADWPHTDPTDLTEFARLMLNLTDASLLLLLPKAHTDPTDPTDFARLMLNLTEVSRCS